MKLVNITDPHIVPDGGLVVGMEPCGRLRQVVDAVNHYHRDASLCVVTGDLTDKGDTASYQLCADILKSLQVPYRLLLGNHDNRLAFQKVLPEEPADDHGFIQSKMDFGDLRLIFLDTLDDLRPDWGVLCPWRMAWLEAALSEGQFKKAVIFMHHPPFSVGVPIFEEMLLQQSEAFLARIAASGKVVHIVFGHLHLTTTGVRYGIPFSCNRGTAHRIALNFSKDVTEFIDSEPTFDVIDISDAGVIVHHTAPTREEDIIAREYATADGRGRIEMIGSSPS